MDTTTQKRLRRATACELRFDDLTRHLYATDGSHYQVMPAGVAFPRTPQEAAQAIRAAADENVPVIPRGAGTGLAGGAIGEGLVIDFARYRRGIRAFDPETRTVHVESGVVLDQLNGFLRPHGLMFGPDVATSSRATLGGMIGNNSSGARSRRFGTTIDHIVSIDVVLADGRTATVGRDLDGLPDVRQQADDLMRAVGPAVAKRFPEGLFKRWPGYGFERWLRGSQDLTRLIGASEGTLAGITGATISLTDLPREPGLAILFFPTVVEAMQAAVELLDLDPVAIEHCDRVMFEPTRGQLEFASARALLGLEGDRSESFLIVEFWDEVPSRLETVSRRRLGTRTLALTDPAAMAKVWGLRKAGLTLLTGRIGPAKPVTCIEDACVLPERLPDYVNGLQKLLDQERLEASFYGHAAAGLLHVRPVLDLHRAEDVRKFRRVSDEVSALVKELKGSISAEHGVGIARTEYLGEHLGPELMDASRKLKTIFDPKGVMNPGKIVPDGRYRLDADLRQGAGAAIRLPFEPVLAFAFKDRSFVGNLEQCNGCGGCRKDVPAMCPTFIATGDEIMSTRGRANTIRAVLESRLRGGLASPELEAALAPCLSCRACTVECPSNVNLSLLKAELNHARQKEQGLTLQERILSRPDRLGRLASRFPRLANAATKSVVGRRLGQAALGISAKRSMPQYARVTFEAWLNHHERTAAGPRGAVALWDDCFVRYNEPNVGAAAVRVLEAAGYGVDIARGATCCGRPAFSLGRLDVAEELARENVRMIGESNAPIVFLEPSCFSMFKEDYAELGIDGAEALSGRAVLFETFVDDLLEREPDALSFANTDDPVAIHNHCHAKATVGEDSPQRLAGRVPGARPQTLRTRCCGMAGAFGMLAAKYDLSLQVGEHLLDQLRTAPPDAAIVASGTSCRQQIAHLHEKPALHMAEWLAAHLAGE